MNTIRKLNNTYLIKKMFIGIAICLMLTGCGTGQDDITSVASNNSSTEITGEETTISFTYYRRSKILTPASGQVAVWIEDEHGNYVKSIYASQFTANGGFAKRPDALRTWVAKSNWGNASQSEVDAVSGATPSSGITTVIWDGLDKEGYPVEAGNYVVMVEGTIYREKQVLYRGELEIGGEPFSATLEPQYNPLDVADNKAMIENVTLSYRQPNVNALDSNVRASEGVSIQYLSGLLALILLIICIAYSILKIFRKSRKLYTVKAHCVIGCFALISAIVHVILANPRIEFSFGFLSLFLLILSAASGILMKRTVSNKYIKLFHIIISAFALVVVLLHIFFR